MAVNNFDLFQRIVLIGAGNLASHLGSAFKNAGFDILQVYSRSEMSAEPLALLFGCESVYELSQITQDADLYVIAVSDSAVQEVLSNIHLAKNQVIVHTSGSLPMSILDKKSENYGVIYSPQTFVKGISLNYNELCFCIEASNERTIENLNFFLKQISYNVFLTDTKRREALHLAAVIAGNFTNCLYGIAHEILAEEDIPFQVLQPLIIETARKPEYGNPKLLQTGPAKRNDAVILHKHMEMLRKDTDYLELYRLFTKIIQKE